MWKMVKQTSQKLVRKRVKTLWLCCISSKRELKIIEACFKGLYQQSNYSYHHNNPCLCSAYFFLKSDGNNIPSHFKCNDSMPISLEILTVVVLWLSPQKVTHNVSGQDMTAQAQTYSSYKYRHTVKYVTGVAPTGAVVYVRKICPGSISVHPRRSP